jgi:hypothetical protein
MALGPEPLEKLNTFIGPGHFFGAHDYRLHIVHGESPIIRQNIVLAFFPLNLTLKRYLS